MSPILVRPVREQLEHDRVIRLLQAKYKRKFEVAINPGNLQVAPVGTAPAEWYPDLVLQSSERSRKLLGVVEVETVESVNNLEAMSQWAAFSRLRAPFHLYVPQVSVDSARRFCVDHNITVAEMWSYAAVGAAVGDQIRFALVQRSAAAAVAAAKAAAKAASAVTDKAPVGARPAVKRSPARPPAPQPAARAKSAKSNESSKSKTAASPSARARVVRVGAGRVATSRAAKSKVAAPARRASKAGPHKPVSSALRSAKRR